MLTYVFPGQGSQAKGMGGTLFADYPELTAQADAILGYSIKELCLEDPQLNLGNTQFTQPALFVVNALSYLKTIETTGKKPDFVAGHSLGEYTALFAAGGFDFATGVQLVKKRGELMGQAFGGGMAAVIGLRKEEILNVMQRNNLETIEVANLNSASQIVISGPKVDIERAQPIFESIQGVMYFHLKTSGAFHSQYMEAAKKEFEIFLQAFAFHDLRIPVISNIHARPYQQAAFKQTLAEQLTHQVKWLESIQYLIAMGEMEFVEVGPGRVLTGLIQRIKKETGN